MDNKISVSPSKQFVSGVKAISPILLGMIPFSMVAGIAAADIGLSPGYALAMSVMVFAGAAQLAALQLLSSGAPFWVIVMTAWMINLRFMLYSASIAPYLKRLPTRWKTLLAYLLTDQAYAVSVIEFERHAVFDNRHWFYFSASLMMWLVWQVGTLTGALLGSQLPESWSLDFAIPLVFIALVVPALKDRPAIAAAFVSGLVASLAAGLPFNLGLPVAVVLGILTGMLVGRGSR
jgi:4-azaleucine resistance transporter AzlC